MPRFAVLEHDHPFLHWDFLLEDGDVLRAWRLHSPPDAGGEIVAEPLPDHRLMYLDYEGPVSGDRGMVKRWDTGEFECIDDTPEKSVVRLTGERLTGTATITCATNRFQFDTV